MKVSRNVVVFTAALVTVSHMSQIMCNQLSSKIPTSVRIWKRENFTVAKIMKQHALFLLKMDCFFNSFSFGKHVLFDYDFEIKRKGHIVTAVEKDI